MSSVRRHLHGFAWLALFATVWLALAPMLSPARAAAGAAVAVFHPWAEICSAAGAGPNHRPGDAGIAERRLAAAGPLGAPAKPRVSPHDDCPLCGHAAAAAALPPADPAALPAVVGSASSMPPLFAQAPRPLFAWHAAQPRGPPVVC